MTSHRLISFVMVSVCWIAAAGCAGPSGLAGTLPRDRHHGPYYLEGVPFFPQEAYQCGPASLAAVLHYWGRAVTPGEIAEAVYLPQRKGSLSLDLWRYARDEGFESRIEDGSIGWLESQLRQKRPVIAFLNRGFRFFPLGHFVVVVGLDPDRETIIAHSGHDQNKRIPYQKFLADWEKTGFWSLLIFPKEKA